MHRDATSLHSASVATLASGPLPPAPPAKKGGIVERTAEHEGEGDSRSCSVEPLHRQTAAVSGFRKNPDNRHYKLMRRCYWHVEHLRPAVKISAS